MGEEQRKIGISELLFGLVIILGIVGTVSFFAFEELFGEHQTTFMIARSLAFIASFFALSVYARSKKRSHIWRVSIDCALPNWIEYVGAIHSSGSQPRQLSVGTLESIVIHVFYQRWLPLGVK